MHDYSESDHTQYEIDPLTKLPNVSLALASHHQVWNKSRIIDCVTTAPANTVSRMAAPGERQLRLVILRALACCSWIQTVFSVTTQAMVSTTIHCACVASVRHVCASRPYPGTLDTSMGKC